ncbi:MAG: helix-turn-helix domain-containing protein [Acidobacteriaceae bacterium]
MLKFDEYVFDVLMRDLVGHDRRLVCFLVYLRLAAEEQRRGRAVQISYQDLAESVGVSKSSAQSAVGWLVRRKLLDVTKQTVTATPQYTVLTPWKRAENVSAFHKAARRGETDAIRQVL